MKKLLNKIALLFDISDCGLEMIPSHDGGRNHIFRCANGILRVSDLDDRTLGDYLAETEFVHYLALNGAPVADVHESINGRFVEEVEADGKSMCVSLFEYAKGMLIADNGYKYRENAPLSEYFYNTGKALGKIHQLSKAFQPMHRRISYFEKYNMTYIDILIPDSYPQLKQAIANRLDEFRKLPQDSETYGLIHFDFSDGNYHVDMETGDITVFDFDNCIYCWYMFDLANLWTHGYGWCMFEHDSEKREEIMRDYFDTILDGYYSETDVSDNMLKKLPLFIDMVLIENIVDEFECCARRNEELDFGDIETQANCLIDKIPYAGFFK